MRDGMVAAGALVDARGQRPMLSALRASHLGAWCLFVVRQSCSSTSTLRSFFCVQCTGGWEDVVVRAESVKIHKYQNGYLIRPAVASEWEEQYSTYGV